MRYLLLCIGLFFLLTPAHSQDTLFTSTISALPLGNKMSIFVDSANQFSLDPPDASRFQLSEKSVPVFLLSSNHLWLRWVVKNNTDLEDFFFSIEYSNIGTLELYQRDSLGKLHTLSVTGTQYPYAQRPVDEENFVFKLSIPAGAVREYYMHVKSQHPVQLPMFLQAPEEYGKRNVQRTWIIGMYVGIIIAIFFYNLFLYFSTRDRSYLLYIMYLFCLLLAQLVFLGWGFKYWWPDHPEVNKYIVILTSSLPGITGLIFALLFLQVKRYSSILYKAFFVIIASYTFVFLCCFFASPYVSYTLLTYNGIIGGLLLIVSSAYIAWKGYRPAYYYFIAWFVFALGRQILSLRNLDVLPYNTFTTYILFIGSAVEAILLSLSLADRINLLQREKDASQAQAFKALQENEKLITEQNILLEGKVAVRTKELTVANEQLSQTLNELQDAQIQLVEAEKMASLGQLTAGIAHEINNPINFVKSNIKPLQMDIKDMLEVLDAYEQVHDATPETLQQQLAAIKKLKDEIDIDYVKSELGTLIKAIEEGAERTAEIVRGLRTFSRLDESDVKKVNIHEGLSSTLVLLRNNIPDNVKIIKDFQAEGNIECYPGKLNQVFMNILNNSIQAVKEKPHQNPEESITLSTRDVGNSIEIHIKDTGIGMTEEVKHKIFNPFFTTKDVGEGTGLGLSIVFKIIQKHHGKIDVVSEPGKGAEFIITLLHTLPDSTVF